MRVIGTSLLMVGLAGGTAAAGPFVNMHRQDAQSRAGVNTTYHLLEGDGSDDVNLIRLEAHGQFISAATGFGGYLSVPVGFVTYPDQLGAPDDEASLGNVEIGGLFLPRSGLGTNNLVVYGGLTLPTAGGDDAEVVLLSSLLRPHDIYQTIPEGITARAWASRRCGRATTSTLASISPQTS